MYDIQAKLIAHLHTLPFDKYTAENLPWLLLKNIQSPLCPNKAKLESEMELLLLDLDKFIIFEGDNVLSNELVQYLTL